jgi:CheY-like chemotaxis protein
MRESQDGNVAANRRRVVVVNDDPGVLDLYRDMLRELDYEPVAMATTGIETEQIRAYEPDAVILDLQVGDEADYGVAMAVQLRGDERMAAIPIVVCTANAEALDGERQTLRDIGVPILLKPLDIETLDGLLSAPVPLSNRPVIGSQ